MAKRDAVKKRAKPISPAEGQAASSYYEDMAGKVAVILADPLRGLGYEIVRIQLSGGRRPVLQIMAEYLDGADIKIEDCEIISKTASALLDVEDPIQGAYVLEVSSPGLDRPLTRRGDFDRFQGFWAQIELRDAQDGRKNFKGILGESKKDEITIACEESVFSFPFDAIKKAKLVLTDELLKSGATKTNK